MTGRSGGQGIPMCIPRECGQVVAVVSRQVSQKKGHKSIMGMEEAGWMQEE
jgi:hypothetical protein